MKPSLLTAFMPRSSTSSKVFGGEEGQSGRLAAHDGDFIHLNPKVAVAGCPNAKKRKHHKKHRRHHRRALR